MIAWISGRVAAVEADAVVVDVAGVGYRIHVPSSFAASIAGAGDAVSLHTYLHVRDSELTLYGAGDKTTMTLFKTLLSVGGVGPRLAMTMLSTLEAANLAAAIDTEDVERLTRVPGVGRKTAQRIILDLRGKLAPEGEPGTRAEVDEAVMALASLGYTRAEARAALDGVDLPSEASVEDRVRGALRSLGAG